MLILVTGGSGSGKSAFAEDRVLSLGEAKRIYIATMHPFDQESFKRIERHRKMRAGKGFDTIECYTGLKDVQISGDSVVLLECMSNLTANEMFEENGAHQNTVEEMNTYLRYLGEINQAVAKMADEAKEVVYGIPIYLKKTDNNK